MNSWREKIQKLMGTKQSENDEMIEPNATSSESADQSTNEPTLEPPAEAQSKVAPRSTEDSTLADELLRRKFAGKTTEARGRVDSGGISFGGATVHVGGNVVGGDYMAIDHDSNDQVIDSLFDSLIALADEQIEPAQRIECRRRLNELRDLCRDRRPDPGKVKASLLWLRTNVPRLRPIFKSILTQPVLPQVVSSAARGIFSEEGSNMAKDIVGRDNITITGGKAADSATDLIAAKMRAKEAEDARQAEFDAEVLREAAKSIREGAMSGGRIQSGGIGDIGGDLKAGGSVIGGDVGGDVTTTITSTTGMSADQFAKAFESIYQRIAAKPQEDQADIKEAVDTIKQAAEKEAAGEKPDAATEKEVKSASQAIVATSPDLIDDVLEVATATLANPAAGVALIVRKVLEKARALRGGSTA